MEKCKILDRNYRVSQLKSGKSELDFHKEFRKYSGYVEVQWLSLVGFG